MFTNVLDRIGLKPSSANRSSLALVDGGIVVIGMKFAAGVAPWEIELLFSGCLFLSNCFSLGLATDEDGPGAKIGNLYYLSWFSLVFPFMIMSDTIDYISKRNEQDQKDCVIDIYEDSVTESLNDFLKTKTLSEHYPSEDEKCCAHRIQRRSLVLRTRPLLIRRLSSWIQSRLIKRRLVKTTGGIPR